MCSAGRADFGFDRCEFEINPERAGFAGEIKLNRELLYPNSVSVLVFL